MNIAYIDSSFLLSILFEDANYERSVDIWNGLDIRLSSILLEIECRNNLYKFLERTKLDKPLVLSRKKILDHLLHCIHKKVIDREILLEMENYDSLKQPRSLDSIHLSTAHIFKRLHPEKILFCSYDRQMNRVAEKLGFSVLQD